MFVYVCFVIFLKTGSRSLAKAVLELTMKLDKMVLFPKPLSTGITVLICEPPQPASFASFELTVLAMASYDPKSSASVLGSQVPPTVKAFLRLAICSGCIT